MVTGRRPIRRTGSAAMCFSTLNVALEKSIPRQVATIAIVVTMSAERGRDEIDRREHLAASQVVGRRIRDELRARGPMHRLAPEVAPYTCPR